ncbi:hypothetical protein EW146_g277 [Bondarzewia mesenterica]|uniref:Uncharacterized protein n=1 Tax=Bondarzewia mesenterica TaxID=1095465 RepID=A0A4S4M7V9_9AGAM|nr:hypothetical protein EW146_g277 [Bondarzewia mesenterica]
MTESRRSYLRDSIQPTDRSIDNAVTALDAEQPTEAKPYIVKAKTPTSEDCKLPNLSVKLSVGDDITDEGFAGSAIQWDGGMHLIGDAESPVEEGKPLLGVGGPSYVHGSTSHKDVEGLLAVGFDSDYASLMASLMNSLMDSPASSPMISLMDTPMPTLAGDSWQGDSVDDPLVAAREELS